ncbi:acyl-CoA dehydrogenase [Mucilaginibacter terrae]|uniref:Alkylation response protein AidB-like acyl-CoA dehydrogenase n=1 Tax=Mucilaginibacter terrae TaxID=1955052 RepID=A0ABU3GW12_9SPHI|nr:acyl-CoA dehydrogenase [Mucilaginibacter terrae]MDT3403952.1 alkylation response protein AidB-like acyl-CoA dehydrogenase [Mucilaginibacter terrae]
MKNQQHPSNLLKPEWVKAIRAEAFAAEEAGMLQAGQLQLIYEQQWFKMLVPKAYGGLELDLPAQIRLEEALSWADGSLGWVVTLCAGACWFGGFIDIDASQQIFNNPKVCLAGSGASTGTADKVDDGYILNGHWRYASGVKHATHFTTNCVIQEDGKPILNADGSPLILSFVVDANQANLVPAWKYVGMMGTGSHAFTLENVHVPANRSFRIIPEATVVDTPLYRYPFLQLAEATLAANMSGMALHFVDLCELIFEQKLRESTRMTEANKVTLMEDLQAVKDDIQNLRNEFYYAVDASWYAALAEREIPVDLLNGVSHTSRLLARAARESVDQLYPYCGLQAAAPNTEINQVWRDLHTASQHALLTFVD